MDTAMSNQNRDDFWSAHGHEGSVQELLNFYWEFGGGKEQFGDS